MALVPAGSTLELTHAKTGGQPSHNFQAAASRYCARTVMICHVSERDGRVHPIGSFAGDSVQRAASLFCLLSLVGVSTSGAQSRFYLDGAFGVTRLSSPITRPNVEQATVGAVAAGYVGARGFGFEVRRAEFQAEATTPSTREPYTVGTRVAVVEVNLTYRPVHTRFRRLAPAVSVGVAQAGVTDYWIADTPREQMQLRARGVTGAVMFDIRVVRRVSLLARIGAQRLTADRGRVGGAFNLNTTTVGGGVRLWL